MARCSFCGNDISLGTGKIFVTKAGKQIYFCSKKCEKNELKLKRKAIHTKWTTRFIKNE